MKQKPTNWKVEFAPFNSNEKTAKALVQLEANVPGYLTHNERKFVAQTLGADALSELDELRAIEKRAELQQAFGDILGCP